MGNHHFQWVNPLEMAIFNSYFNITRGYFRSFKSIRVIFPGRSGPRGRRSPDVRRALGALCSSADLWAIGPAGSGAGTICPTFRHCDENLDSEKHDKFGCLMLFLLEAANSWESKNTFIYLGPRRLFSIKMSQHFAVCLPITTENICSLQYSGRGWLFCGCAVPQGPSSRAAEMDAELV